MYTNQFTSTLKSRSLRFFDSINGYLFDSARVNHRILHIWVEAENSPTCPYTSMGYFQEYIKLYQPHRSTSFNLPKQNIPQPWPAVYRNGCAYPFLTIVGLLVLVSIWVTMVTFRINRFSSEQYGSTLQMLDSFTIYLPSLKGRSS